MDNNMDRYIGQTLDGRYAISEKIGSGGMAVVYRAQDTLLNRSVAIKILRDDMASDREFRDHFKAEAQAVAMLSHQNIMSVYDVSRVPNPDYIVMELVEGQTLKQYMLSQGTLSEGETVHFAAQICRALSHAHSKGIIHRDIKPQNIMITGEGVAKVTDFGIAYLENTQKMDSKTAVGSVHYISPEQAQGHPVDARSDIYSLGVVMYEMLTGTLPYTGDTVEAIALQHIAGKPRPLSELNPEVSPKLEAITLKAMNADIQKRYQTASELLAALEALRGGGTESGDGAGGADVYPDVEPISRTGEMSRESYARRSRRAGKVSLLSGIFLVLVFIVAVFAFLWSYWLDDLFADSERINIPNFAGSDYEDIIHNSEFTSIYNFTVVRTPNAEYDEGIIISQSPAEGKSLALDEDGIDVTLTVSSGIQLVEIPDVINMDYREASITLTAAGFEPELEYSASDSVTADYVMYTSPDAGEVIPTGTTVYVTVSTGPESITVDMPNLIGLSRDAAVEKLESANLSVGAISYTTNELPEGTVIWQSITANTEVEQYTKVYLQISTGDGSTN